MGQIVSTVQATVWWSFFGKKPSAPQPLASEIKDDMHWTQWPSCCTVCTLHSHCTAFPIRNTKQELGTTKLCNQPFNCLVMFPEARSAAPYKGPSWDAVIDIPIQHCQKVSNLRVMRQVPAVSRQESLRDAEQPLRNRAGDWDSQSSKCMVSQIRQTNIKGGILPPRQQSEISTGNIQFLVDRPLSGGLQQLLGAGIKKIVVRTALSTKTRSTISLSR